MENKIFDGMNVLFLFCELWCLFVRWFLNMNGKLFEFYLKEIYRLLDIFIVVRNVKKKNVRFFGFLCSGVF